MPLSQQMTTTLSLNFFSSSPLCATCSCGTCFASMTWPESNSALLRTSTQDRALVQQPDGVRRADRLAAAPQRG